MKPELQRRLEKMQQDALWLGWVLLGAIGFVLIMSGFLLSGEM